MATTLPLAAKPLDIGLKHAGLSFAGLAGLLVLGAGAIQIFGKAEDAGPRAEVLVPQFKAAEAEKPANGDAALGGAGVGGVGGTGWRAPDGAMTPWLPGTPPPKSLEDPAALTSEQAAKLAQEARARGEPVPTSVMAAASAQASGANGRARILAPQFGSVSDAAVTTQAGVRIIRGGTRGTPLAQAPAAGVHQQGPNGLLPIIGLGGRTIFEAYKKPFSDTGRAKIALVVGGLGLNARITQRAIDELPADVTLSFVPYADNLQGWINKARAAGHEVMIEIPMEPFDYPDNDPGPHTLLSTATAEENQRRLEFLLSRATGYFAVTNYLGGRLAESREGAGAVMRALKGRGISFISDGSADGLANAARGAGLRGAQADRTLDQTPSGADIAAQLGALEANAKQKGEALGFGVAYSVTIDQIAIWARDAARRGITLAPASAVAS